MRAVEGGARAFIWMEHFLPHTHHSGKKSAKISHDLTTERQVF